VAIKKEVTLDAIEKAKKAFAALPTKAPATKPVAEALEDLKTTLEDAIQKGYSKDDVIQLLSKQGIAAKAYQLKALFAAKRKAASKE
jgi:hypothetical protein